MSLLRIVDTKALALETSSYTELNGRSDSNLIDVMNAAVNYGFSKRDIIGHIEKKELGMSTQKSCRISLLTV